MFGLTSFCGRSQALLLGAVLSFAGCGGGAGDAPTVYPVTGKVSKGGTALANITVNFVPMDDASGLPSTGVTNEEGVYELARHTGDKGAMAGAYKVVLVDNDSQASATDYSNPGAGGPQAKASRIPAKWGTKDDSPKTAQVEEKENTIDIEVTE